MTSEASHEKAGPSSYWKMPQTPHSKVPATPHSKVSATPPAKPQTVSATPSATSEETHEDKIRRYATKILGHRGSKTQVSNTVSIFMDPKVTNYKQFTEKSLDAGIGNVLSPYTLRYNALFDGQGKKHELKDLEAQMAQMAQKGQMGMGSARKMPVSSRTRSRKMRSRRKRRSRKKISRSRRRQSRHTRKRNPKRR